MNCEDGAPKSNSTEQGVRPLRRITSARAVPYSYTLIQ
jgi:hypothetical protein